MGISAESIRSLVDGELLNMHDIRVKNHVRQFLVNPKRTLRLWDYGEPGEMYECWTVLDHEASNAGIVYCEFGFGPKCPWGLVFISGTENEMSLGMDCGWFQSFFDAYFDSFVSLDLPIWRVFKRTSGAYPGNPISEESDWDLTWEKVNKFREQDKFAKYECHHSIVYGKPEI